MRIALSPLSLALLAVAICSGSASCFAEKPPQSVTGAVIADDTGAPVLGLSVEGVTTPDGRLFPLGAISSLNGPARQFTDRSRDGITVVLDQTMPIAWQAIRIEDMQPLWRQEISARAYGLPTDFPPPTFHNGAHYTHSGCVAMSGSPYDYVADSATGAMAFVPVNTSIGRRTANRELDYPTDWQNYIPPACLSQPAHIVIAEFRKQGETYATRLCFFARGTNKLCDLFQNFPVVPAAAGDAPRNVSMNYLLPDDTAILISDPGLFEISFPDGCFANARLCAATPLQMRRVAPRPPSDANANGSIFQFDLSDDGSVFVGRSWPPDRCQRDEIFVAVRSATGEWMSASRCMGYLDGNSIRMLGNDTIQVFDGFLLTRQLPVTTILGTR